MSEQIHQSIDKDLQKPKNKQDKQKDLTGVWGKTIYEVRNKVEKLKKPEAQEFFDFWRLITQNKKSKQRMNMSVGKWTFDTDSKTGERKYFESKSNMSERTDTSYQTFKWNTLTIMIDLYWDLNINDGTYDIDTKQNPNWKDRFATNYKDQPDDNWEMIPIPKYDPTYNNKSTKIQLHSDGSILLQEKIRVEDGVMSESYEWSDPIKIDGNRAADFIVQLKKKFLDRYVNRDPDQWITDNNLNRILKSN